MKRTVIILFILFGSNSLLFCQVEKDSVGSNYIYPQFYDSFSAEESWEIHREAYIKQLKSKGLTGNELEERIFTYENQKKELIKEIIEQRRKSEIQRNQADEQRKLSDNQRVQADELRKEADAQRKIADEQRKRADELRKEAEIIRKQAEEIRAQHTIQREKAAELRKQADTIRKQAQEVRIVFNVEKEKAVEKPDLTEIIRKQVEENRIQDSIEREEAAEKQHQLADIFRKQAEEIRIQHNIQREAAEELRKQAVILRTEANELRKLADIQRAKADELRKKADKSRNSFEDILSKKITLSNKSATIKPITFKIHRKATLVFNIESNISSGNISIEIINPKGKKEGEMSLENKNKSGQIRDGEFLKYTSGILNKTISDSEIGEWQIKISSKKSEGTISVSVAQFVKPIMDE